MKVSRQQRCLFAPYVMLSSANITYQPLRPSTTEHTEGDNRVAWCAEHNPVHTVERKVRHQLKLPLPKSLVERQHLHRTSSGATPTKSAPPSTTKASITPDKTYVSEETLKRRLDELAEDKKKKREEEAESKSKSVMQKVKEAIGISSGSTKEEKKKSITADDDEDEEEEEEEIKQAPKVQPRAASSRITQSSEDEQRKSHLLNKLANKRHKRNGDAESSSSEEEEESDDEPTVISDDEQVAVAPTETLNEDETRQRFVEHLIKALDNPAEAPLLAKQIEKQIYRAFSDVNDNYKSKLRSLIVDLKSNKEVKTQLLDGDISPAQLVKMSFKDLAPAEVQAARKTAAVEAAKDRVVTAAGPPPRAKHRADNLQVVAEVDINIAGNTPTKAKASHNGTPDTPPSLEKVDDIEDIDSD